ncbi:MAG: cytochrome c oxidase accessory protein CcoG [Saprospiraceae bacterium]|nr:cytochrome c oxidase accessory protein CcoG [Saprospiraceae bacterium]
MIEDSIYDTGNAAFRDRMSDTTAEGKRKWFYVSRPNGKFTKWRSYLNFFYFALFFTLPLLRYQGRPFFMINFPKGEFIVFGKIFWPQDFFLFAMGMITMIVFVILFTVIFGRLFCGWVCPQTVFLEGLFRKIEWWIEGSPAQQKKLDQMPWNWEKIRKKGLKHLIFLAISFLIANTFLAYIISTDELVQIIREPVTEHLTLLTGIIAFTLTFYGVFAYVREIVCTTICPYGRLQSVLLDQDSMQVSYDYVRGEPRGKMSRNAENDNGDCIDCKKCVIVCPTGIDIRDGIQMECVGCTACIDACDEVMDKIGRPLGLIRYASEKEIRENKKFKFTSRMKVYSGVLVVLLGIMTYMIASSKSISGNISRVKGQLYQELEGGKLSNLYEAKILNKMNKEYPVELKLIGTEGSIKMVDTHPVLKKQGHTNLTFFVILDENKVVKRSNKITIGIYAGNELMDKVNTTFLGPF